MESKTAEHILVLQEKAMQNSHYTQALRAYRKREQQLLQLLPFLPQDQQDIITDYVGLLFEMQLYLLELSCT